MSSRLDPYALVGTTFRDRYSVESFVGVGRFSVVYRGTETATARPVALRLLKVKTTLTPSQRTVVVERLRGLTRPITDVAACWQAFADVLEVGALITSGRWMPTLVQTWLDGETLESVLVTERQLKLPLRTLARTIDLMTPVADALGYAHARGLVHGSLAPRSVFVRDVAREDWATIEIIDLGIAQAMSALQAKDGAFHGTPPHGEPPLGRLFFFAPAYGSPEHFKGDLAALTPASDVFALALMTVELLTGRSPLGDGDDEQLEATSVDPVHRPTPRTCGRDLGGYVEAVFGRALAVRPEDRYTTVSSFWEALRAAARMTTLRPSSSSVRPPPLPKALRASDADTPRMPASVPRPLPFEDMVPHETPVDAAPARETPRDFSPLSERVRREAAPPTSVRATIPPEEFFDEGYPASLRETFPSIPGTNPLFAGEPESRQIARSLPPTEVDADASAQSTPTGTAMDVRVEDAAKRRRAKRIVTLGGTVLLALIVGLAATRTSAGKRTAAPPTASPSPSPSPSPPAPAPAPPSPPPTASAPALPTATATALPKRPPPPKHKPPRKPATSSSR